MPTCTQSTHNSYRSNVGKQSDAKAKTKLRIAKRDTKMTKTTHEVSGRLDGYKNAVIWRSAFSFSFELTTLRA